MAISGVVRVWHEEGWGVIDSEDTPGGCWAHFSSILVPGYRALRAGESMMFECEPIGQEGYSFRAVEVLPVGLEPYRTECEAPTTSDAYHSTLTLTLGDSEEPDRA
jgi:CspA family cold shock protein